MNSTSITRNSTDEPIRVYLDPAEHPASREWVGQYKLVQLLQKGRTFEVWSAETSQRRVCTLKLFHRRFQSVAQEDAFLMGLFAASRIHHGSIHRIREVGRIDDEIFVVTDAVSGIPMLDWFIESEPNLREVVAITCRLAEALGHLHAHSLVHGALSPEHVSIVKSLGGARLPEESITPVILGLGTARYELDDWPVVLANSTPYQDPASTGTPHSDLYSIGAILYYLLSGVAPHPRKRGAFTASRPLAPRKVNRAIPKDLEAIVLKCMAPNRARRYRTLGDLAAILRAWNATNSWRHQEATQAGFEAAQE